MNVPGAASSDDVGEQFQRPRQQLSWNTSFDDEHRPDALKANGDKEPDWRTRGEQMPLPIAGQFDVSIDLSDGEQDVESAPSVENFSRTSTPRPI
eukprot:5824152-Pyramimonas_sp.AAC.1